MTKGPRAVRLRRTRSKRRAVLNLWFLRKRQRSIPLSAASALAPSEAEGSPRDSSECVLRQPAVEGTPAQPDKPRQRIIEGFSSEGLIARRLALFRALGRDEAPPQIELRGRRYRRATTLKHDSWAATAVYIDESGARVACKFNRVHPVLLVPMAWLGRGLARRERKVLQLMEGIEVFPRWSGPVLVNGMEALNAVSHDWIDGRTFSPQLPVEERFFPALRAAIGALHAHNIAYVDMSKWENILVGDDGRPRLIDFQVHFHWPHGGPLRWWLRQLQKSDLYYLHRHWMRARPEQFSPEERERWQRQPAIVRIGERLGRAWRATRILALRLFGVRGDPRRQGVRSS